MLRFTNLRGIACREEFLAEYDERDEPSTRGETGQSLVSVQPCDEMTVALSTTFPSWQPLSRICRGPEKVPEAGAVWFADQDGSGLLRDLELE